MTLQAPRSCGPSSRSGHALGRWRLAFAALVLVAGAACMDGYPTQDAAAMDPLDMTQPQRLAQMNALGGDAHPERRWSYALLPGCVLRIDPDGAAGPRAATDIPLLGAAVKVYTDKASDTFNVDISPTGPTARDDITVLEARDWADAVGMARVLRFVEMGCTDGA